MGDLSTPRPLHRRCRAAEVGWTGTSARSSLLEAVCPLLRSAQLPSAPHPRARATKGAGDGERLLSRRRCPNPPQLPLLRIALHCCAAAAATDKQRVGKWEQKMGDARLRVRSVLGEGRCANGRRRPLGLLASSLALCRCRARPVACCSRCRKLSCSLRRSLRSPAASNKSPTEIDAASQSSAHALTKCVYHIKTLSPTARATRCCSPRVPSVATSAFRSALYNKL